MGKRSGRFEAFLSHASQHGRFAGRLAKALRKRGFATWYSKTHLRGAQQWHDEIGRALLRCTHFVVLLSPDAVRSMWVKRELSYALRQRRYDGKIVPVLYRACDVDKLSWTLTSSQIIDGTGRFETTVNEIIRSFSGSDANRGAWARRRKAGKRR